MPIYTTDLDAYELYAKAWELRAARWRSGDVRAAKLPTLTLWADVPAERRVTEKRLLQCFGAQFPDWLERWRKRLREPGCQAAVRFNEVFGPCGNRIESGARFCTTHQRAWRILEAAGLAPSDGAAGIEVRDPAAGRRSGSPCGG